MISADVAVARPADRDPAAGAAGDEHARRRAEIAAAASTGLDPCTGLASDFLNQFNEVSMLLDMAADDADMLDELTEWQPRGYVTHFETSNFRDAGLVLEAYALCPADIRHRFDTLAAALAAAITDGLAEITGNGDAEAAAARCGVLAGDVRARIESLSAVIHPTREVASNSDISALFSARR
jgi:hypothetical protein